jgi:cell division initiation protein
MNLTALEIKQRTFEKSWKGYDVAEVDSFLTAVAAEWELAVGKMKEQEREISQLRDKLKHYERVEEALHETLQSAKENAEQRIETARKEAQSKIRKAEVEAETILQEVRIQRQDIRQSILRLLDRRDEIIRGIGSYIDTAQKTLQSFSKDESNIYSLTKDDRDENQQEKKTVSKDDKKNDQNNKKEKVSASTGDDVDDILDEID